VPVVRSLKMRKKRIGELVISAFTKKMVILICLTIFLPTLSLMVGRRRMCNFDLASLASPDTKEIFVKSELVPLTNNLVARMPDKGYIQAKTWLQITSGYRTVAHNQKVGGAKRSYHMRGMAIDCYCRDISNTNLAKMALECGFTTAIVYKTHVHLDIREKGLGLRKK